MFYIANQILRDTYLAEDAVHQAFIKVIKNLDKIEDISSARTRSFISTITKNCAFDEYKKQKSQLSVPIEDMEEVLFDKEDFASDNDLAKIIHGMAAIYRDVLVLMYHQGFTVKEIAKILNIQENAVKKRLDRGRRMLAEQLEREHVTL